jgi:hypothetical protein
MRMVHLELELERLCYQELQRQHIRIRRLGNPRRKAVDRDARVFCLGRQEETSEPTSPLGMNRGVSSVQSFLI